MSQKQAIYQINTNQHKPTQIKFKSTQIKTIQHKSIQTNTNQFKTKQININQRKSIQIKTNQHKPTHTNQNKLIKTNQYKTKQSTHINTNEYKSHNVPNITKYITTRYMSLDIGINQLSFKGQTILTNPGLCLRSDLIGY